MAHRFANFADAFEVLESNWLDAYEQWGYLGEFTQRIKDHADYGQWRDGLYDCAYGLWKVYEIFQEFENFYDADSLESPAMECHYWSSQEPAGDGVSLDAILNAMLTATPEQITHFVGIVDAFRQSIWNKPFNKEYFAALAKGFQEWP